VINHYRDEILKVYVRIVHSFGEDHTGFPAIDFRIPVRDEDAPVARLRNLARRLSIALMNRAKTDENGLAFQNRRNFEIPTGIRR
jgi:hypothetical protein